jgi:beta-N-acetylhexosaminidase
MTVGQRLIVGIDKPHLTDPLKSIISKYQVGGVILFDRNGPDRRQLKKLITEIRSNCAIRPFVAIDYEGGRVSRLKGLFPSLDFPSAYIDNPNKLKDDCRQVAESFGEAGINVNFAPVADLSYSPLNPALKDRTFAFEPESVAEYCRNFIEGFKMGDVLCCAKHFPGLGSAINDPHIQTAISCIAAERLRQCDLAPFKAAVAAGVKMLMTTHMIMTALSDKIVTFAPEVTGLARELGFEGLLITDDLSMGAVRDKRPLEILVLDSLCAGHDIALVCHDHEKYPGVLDYLETNLDILEEHGHRQALARIENVKKNLP